MLTSVVEMDDVAHGYLALLLSVDYNWTSTANFLYRVKLMIQRTARKFMGILCTYNRFRICGGTKLLWTDGHSDH